jgi:hypothetical protein
MKSSNINIINTFSNKENLNMLWEVLLDELNIKSNPSNKTVVNGIQAVFQSNISPFITKINPSSGIMDVNKLFLKQVLTAVNRLFPNLNQEQNIKRIQIGNEEISEPYKVEDIHTARQNNFEKQLQQQREDFDKFSTIKKPKEPNFTEKIEEPRITEMQSLIAETIAKRNFEVEQYHTNLESAETWLQPTKTSVKNEKQTINTNTNTNVANNETINRKLKHISIDNMNNINNYENSNVIEKNLKTVSWEDDANTSNNISLIIDDTDVNIVNSNNNSNIFSKLKKINTSGEPIKETINTNVINDQNKDIIKLTQQIELLNTKFDTLIDKMMVIIENQQQTQNQ